MTNLLIDLNQCVSFVIKKCCTFNKALINVSKNNFYNSNKKPLLLIFSY